MKSRKSQLYIGTSGWKYPHWKKNFYPEDLKASQEFPYYFSLFDTVELNNPFYKNPTEPTIKKWKLDAPDGFTYAIKANRYFSHLKKLNVEKNEVYDFLDKFNNLKKKLGPILFQLPPRWNKNFERLENFLKLLPKKYRYAIEFRNESWEEKELFLMLKKYNMAYCIFELAGYLSPLAVTADFVYIRLHGPGAKYSGSYSTPRLKKWAAFCTQQQKLGKDVYIYFDNDENGHAPKNALTLKKLIDGMA